MVKALHCSLIASLIATFIPSDNKAYKAYKSCGIRPKVSSIDEPTFRTKRNLNDWNEQFFRVEEDISVEELQSLENDRSRRGASDTRIMNGRALSLDGEWPWLSMVVRQGTENDEDARIQCVGVLINCNTVLTTANCAKTVATGDQGLKLNFPSDSSFLTSNCWALGVTTSDVMVEAPFQSSAVQLDVDKQSLKYCNRYGYAGQLDKDQHACIKAKWDSEKQGFCQLADNGAPVVCKRENSQNEFFLLGLFSSSEKCETFPKPAIFQETASFTNWIEETIQKEKKCICHRVIPGRQLISPDRCCLNSPYNSGMKECCGGKLIDLDGRLKCCYGVPYDHTTHGCNESDGLIFKQL